MIDKMTGYIAIDKNFEFKPGMFLEFDKIKNTSDFRFFKYDVGKRPSKEELGRLNGFYFFVYPSRAGACIDTTNKLYRIEAFNVLEERDRYVGAGAIRTCQAIRLIEEMQLDEHKNAGTNNTGIENIGHNNTGNQNTGYANSGDLNAGNYNTGDENIGNVNSGLANTGNKNTGDANEGDQNTGHNNIGNKNTGDKNRGDLNLGHYNTGNRNTGDSNVGDYNIGNNNKGHNNIGDLNIGNANTGSCNIGDSNSGGNNTGNYNVGDANYGNGNTGHRNKGNYNTGNYNVTSNCTGFFCTKEPTVYCFDVDTGLTQKEFLNKFPNVLDLFYAMEQNIPIDYKKWLELPGFSEEAVEKYKTIYNYIQGKEE